MTTSTINSVTNKSALSLHSSSRRPTFDIMVERAARSMLAWSDRRVNRNQVSHERMHLLRANECLAAHGGSAVAR